MRIAINARSILLEKRTGIGRYAYHLIDSLGSNIPNNEYWLYVQKKFWDTKRKVPKFSYPNISIKNDFFAAGLSRSLKGADVYHSPSPSELDIEGPKVVVTIHDLIYKTFPQSHTQATIELTDHYMQQIVRSVDHIICVSHSTRDDLHRFFDFPKEKSSVVYNGVDHKVFYSLKEESDKLPECLHSLGVQKPFILFVGTIEPRKNLITLLKSFALLRSKKQFTGQLVIAGMKGWMTEKLGSVIRELGLSQEVVFVGFVSDDRLRDLYNAAEVFVFPSLYEGFGFPILEAFCCGVPVVTSNTSSCNEVASDAALRVDPQNIEQLTDAIARLCQDKVLRKDLITRGFARAKGFSFLKTAQETFQVYQQLN